MGLKDFLVQQGFIEDAKAAKQPVTNATPSFFPVQSVTETASKASDFQTSADPSFVTPLQQNTSGQEQLDPTFVKFFEDELAKSNLPGPDYFEFRHQLTKTQQKMATKGVVAPEVVLQAVLMSFESQDISSAKLAEGARHYKQIIKQKNDDFLKGASAEKNNQLQKRQNALQVHDDNIRKIQQQLQQLEVQKRLLDESLNKEKTQMEVDKTLGKEGIEKIEKAERLISLAHNYIQSTIDNDIKRLQTV